MTISQEDFEATIRKLRPHFPRPEDNQFTNDDWITWEKHLPEVVELAETYRKSRLLEANDPARLQPTGDFIDFLQSVAYAIHDNDVTACFEYIHNTAHVAHCSFYDEYRGKVRSPLTCYDCYDEKKKADDDDKFDYAYEAGKLRRDALYENLRRMLGLVRSDFGGVLKSAIECVNMCHDPDEDQERLAHAAAYSGLGMVYASMGDYMKGLGYMHSAERYLKRLSKPYPAREKVIGYNFARHLYCMGRYEKAEEKLGPALKFAEQEGGWYTIGYGHLTFASLRVRQGRIADARGHVEKARAVLDAAGDVAKNSWLSSYCAYRTGVVATLQCRVHDAITATRDAVEIGGRTKLPIAMLARCTHAYARALAMDETKVDESKDQHKEARRLREEMVSWMEMEGFNGGDLDDESDHAFDMLVKIDQR